MLGMSCWIFTGSWASAEIEAAGQTRIPQETTEVTNLLQIRQMDFSNLGISYPVSLKVEGLVCWASPAQNQLALQDGSNGLVLELEGRNQVLKAGQRVRLSGTGWLSKRGSHFVMVSDLVVENDGLHQLTEKSGATFLKAGRTPIRVEWFNRTGDFGLAMAYEGPELPLRKMSDTELYRRQKDGLSWENGLDYRCYEGLWNVLPNFNQLKPVRTGICSNLDLSVRSRDENVGLQFAGFLEVPRDGVYTFYLRSDDGSRLFLGEPNVRLEVIGSGTLPMPRRIAVGQILGEQPGGLWAEVEGKVTQVVPEGDGLRLELSVGLARMTVEVADAAGESPALLMNRIIQAVGFCEYAYNTDGLKIPDLLLVSSGSQIEKVNTAAATRVSGLPVLTTAAAVHRLKREEAQLQYPVKVRGVVTAINPEPRSELPAFTVQDSTSGLYVDGSDRVLVGEFVEVEGVTDPGLFAPMLKPVRINRLGVGQLPEPIQPSWDQLMNGSMDAQYVELNGIVTASAPERVQLLTAGGVIKVDLIGAALGELKAYENTLVQIRGVLLATWNGQTHQVRPGEIRMSAPNIIVKTPAPADVFSAPYKSPAELLLFDPQASMFQRIRTSGQIVHVGPDTCFMMAGNNGLRFVTSQPGDLRTGDLVEVAGYPDLGSASPVLREAVAHKTGHEALPEARRLPPGNPVAPEYDSTRVRVEGVLMEVRGTPGDGVWEVQDGARRFVARLKNANNFLHSLPIGCRLELTGVYAVTDGNVALGQEVTSFELLLDSSADIKILARPPWWTLKRLLVVTGALVCVLAGALLWITQLHRKVEQRTSELETQIRQRENIERHRAMDQERARIARDLHDELGSGLTEISMLATVPAVEERASPDQNQIAERARQMVTALDEIVWATNPKHDSLASLGSYFCLYADRFLKPANITCHLKGTLDLPDRPLDSISRHELFLAFKEALTNVVRHSGATELRLDIRIIGNRLRLALADNGGGLGANRPVMEGMDGLANMRTRLEKMGGRFAITSWPGRGTTLRFYVPLD